MAKLWPNAGQVTGTNKYIVGDTAFAREKLLYTNVFGTRSAGLPRTLYYKTTYYFTYSKMLNM